VKQASTEGCKDTKKRLIAVQILSVALLRCAQQKDPWYDSFRPFLWIFRIFALSLKDGVG